ncbi:Gfo/Idh/MocA family oxidoreductase [uncultured Bacteroides sp.]|uniref:Gfo/Idh/MocA family oxidoreductase n=1 Tax=uncultured Bacteroides sp. TaxID=162156 RepID=UPI002AA63A5C|nr:Gfo/Idh/MocA family oxidoreductase [uncultured Bacteroides sp.]
MDIIKTGLAAYGMSGQVFHAPFIHANQHFELCKIVERDKELSKEQYPQANIVRSFDELLQDKALKLIIVNTPDSTHYEYALKALQAGKNVVVEKPFTTTTPQAEELIALAQEKNLMLSVYQNRRWDADFLAVKEIINKGILGRLVEFESTFARYRNFIKPNTWKETGEAGGGLTYNLGAHLIDQALQLFGMPKAIYADIATMRTGGIVDDYFFIHFLRPALAPSLKLSLKASYLMCNAEPRFVLHGTLGSFVKRGVDKQEAALLIGEKPDQLHWGEENEQEWGLLHTQINGKEICQKYPSPAGNYGAFYENIYEHIYLHQTLETDARGVLNVIKIIEAAYQSSKEERVIYLS